MSREDRAFRSAERNAGVEASEQAAARRISTRHMVAVREVEARLKRAGLVGPIGNAARIQWEADARRSLPNVAR